MTKQLIKVVATAIVATDGGKFETTTARGVTALPRGQKLIDFIKEFLIMRMVTTFTLNQRGENDWATSPMMYLFREPKLVLIYNFKQFGIDELGYFVKDLSKAEQERDLKPLKRFI